MIITPHNARPSPAYGDRVTNIVVGNMWRLTGRRMFGSKTWFDYHVA